MTVMEIISTDDARVFYHYTGFFIGIYFIQISRLKFSKFKKKPKVEILTISVC